MIAVQLVSAALGLDGVMSSVQSMGGLLAASDPMSHVVPHTIVNEITNHMVMLILAAVLLLIFIPMAARQKSLVPTGFRNFLETLLQFIREDVARPVLGKHTDKFIPFLSGLWGEKLNRERRNLTSEAQKLEYQEERKDSVLEFLLRQEK